MNSELRAAAERIVAGITKTVRDKSTSYERKDMSCFLLGLQEPYELAVAYLASHPDDSGLAVDEKWLRAVGFDPFPDYPFILRLRSGDNPDQLIDWTEDGGFDIPHFDLSHIKTRSDVRLLARALGIQLRETTDGE